MRQFFNKNMMDQLNIRRYRESDCEAVSGLFYETVHSVNAGDYTSEQLFAWAKAADSLQTRQADLLNQNTLIAEIGGMVVGFGSITGSGCLDLLFVHKDFQGRGIGTELCNILEQGFSCVQTYASITAKPFFQKRGYIVIRPQKVERFGVELTNYEMRKNIDDAI